MAGKLRGSEKHLVDLLNSREYPAQLNGLLVDADARIIVPAEHKREDEIPSFCKGFNGTLVDHAAIAQWWLPPSAGRQTRGATWDLLANCKIAGKDGLLLVEAKAHEEELDYSGKPLALSASIQSKANHEHIRRNLREASGSLNERAAGVFALSIEGHYQLANRIAWAWKLAECGVPVILLYLGFTGDTYFRYDCFKDADHWQRAMGAYLHGVVPQGLPGTRVDGQNGGAFTMLVKSLPVGEVSV